MKNSVIPDYRAKKAIARNRKRAKAIGFLYCVFLLIATAASVFACVWYIRAKSELAVLQREIRTLEDRLLELRAENDAAEAGVRNSFPMTRVLERAMEYGMRYPTEDDIVYYREDASGTPVSMLPPAGSG